ncbi:uncharacterized protein VTP21DRAFT_8019 [Calcarisporiella thermophila]|uniref:uncharacterized protein n=1 Tax=Calcarisporiella thermophila TaxID=911321 RepID=UPI003742B63B
MSKKLVHILIGTPSAMGHVIPALALARRILNTPSLQEIDGDIHGSDRLVTLLIPKSFSSVLKEKPIFPITDDEPKILTSCYGSLRVVWIEDKVELDHTQDDGSVIGFFASLQAYLDNLGRYIKSTRTEMIDTIRPTCLILDSMFGMLESFPIDSIPLYFLNTSTAALTSNDLEDFKMPGIDNPTHEDMAQKFLMEGVKRSASRVSSCEGVIWNTARCVDGDNLERFLHIFQHKIPLYPVGPLNYFNIKGESIVEREKNSEYQKNLVSASHNTTTPSDLEVWISQYLNEHGPYSILYVSFGTSVSHSTDQLIELLNGLKATERNVLWSLNKNQQKDLPKSNRYIPAQGVLVYNNVTIVEWAPQTMVLSHTSCAAFLTHCGWNSSLESLTYGVATINWPVYFDQYSVSKLLVELGVGISFELGLITSPPESQTRPNIIPAEMITLTIVNFFDEKEKGDDRYSKTAKRVSEELRLAWTPEGEAYRELARVLSQIEKMLE